MLYACIIKYMSVLVYEFEWPEMSPQGGAITIIVQKKKKFLLAKRTPSKADLKDGESENI